jgi:SAM-dependent methyltransferase
MDPKSHYSRPDVVDFYRVTAGADGLWPEEEAVITPHLPLDGVLLNAGCGAGRISFGLWELGYRRVIGIDLARPMIEAARLLAAKLEYAVSFRVGDLTRLGFDAGTFDGVIWSGNGIADCANPATRVAALTELRRVTRVGGTLVLSSPYGEAPEGLAAELAGARWTVLTASSTTSQTPVSGREPGAFPANTRYWLVRAAA